MKRAMSEQEINCLKTLLKDFDAGQVYAVLLGLEQNLDVSVYANSIFSWSQMHEIRTGLEHWVDVSSYADPKLHSREMRKILMNLVKVRVNN